MDQANEKFWRKIHILPKSLNLFPCVNVAVGPKHSGEETKTPRLKNFQVRR